MRKSVAKLLTGWIPSARYRRVLRQALCDMPSGGTAAKGRFGAGGSRYGTLVVPRGFGHSGSGVIGDLLSEYDDTTVFGGADPDGSGRWAGVGRRNATSFEVDILKMYGGVMDLASAFGESRAWGKFKLLNFIHAVEFLYRQPDIPIYDDEFLARSRAFVGEITRASWRSATPMAENMPFERREWPPDCSPGLQNPLYGLRDNLSESYVMRDISVAEYEAIARRYMDGILSSIPSRRILVMDQLCSADLPVAEFEKYIGPFKLIPVVRDPRDVFCTGAARCMPWIPNEPRAFVEWYRSLGIEALRDCGSPSVLMLRFEDLVRDYGRSVAAVEKFVGLSPEAHVRPKTAFDPERSARNIGIWRAFPDQKAMEAIRAGLPEFCVG